MKKIIALAVIVSCAFQAGAFEIGAVAGDYGISRCKSLVIQSAVDFCAYDELEIEPIESHPTEVKFSFLKDSIVGLSFAIKTNDRQNDLIADENPNVKLALNSHEDGVESSMSIENLDGDKLLSLSTSGNGLNYKFKMILRKTYP